MELSLPLVVFQFGILLLTIHTLHIDSQVLDRVMIGRLVQGCLDLLLYYLYHMQGFVSYTFGLYQWLPQLLPQVLCLILGHYLEEV